ncbi:MAG: O-antigen ligase family protein [Patescibacteria group bacterium]|nr:O-antigen ligase family protein [Patescibacteria group bacterium]
MLNKILDWMIVLIPLALPLYVVRFDVGPLPTTLLELYLGILTLVWVINVLRPTSQSSYVKAIKDAGRATRDVRQSIGSWFWPLIAWLIVTLIAVFVAQDSLAAFGHWRAFMLEPVLVFVILNNVLRRSSQSSHVQDDALDKPHHDKGEVWRGLFLSIAVVTILLGVYAIFQYLTGWGIPSPWDVAVARRATGIFGYPNGLSLFIVPFGIVSFMRLIDTWLGDHMGSPLQMLMYGSASALALVATVLAKSMGGILAFGVGVVLTLIIYKKTRVIGIVLTVLGVLSASLVAWQIYGTELHPSTIEDSLVSSKKWSSSVRVIIWKESFEIIKDHPILGTGLRSFKTAILPYHTATWMETFPHPHNILLMLWIETGLLGLLSFIWLIGTWVIMVIRPRYMVLGPGSDRSQDDVPRTMDQLVWLIPLVVILVHGMVDMPYFKNDLAIQFFLLAAIATTIKRIPELGSGTNK